MCKEDLENIFAEAKEKVLDVFLELTVPDSDVTEIIVVKYGNLDRKLNYYLENYDENLKLKRCDKIQILSANLDVYINKNESEEK